MASNKKDYGYTNYERWVLRMSPKKKKKTTEKKTKNKARQKNKPKPVLTQKEYWFRSYRKFLKTQYWAKVRETVIKRDKFCQECHSDKYLQVHHLSYRHYKKELEHLDDLILLCQRCHKLYHQKE